MSASQLAAELEVSERTVLRDIEALSTSGFPVYAERGRHGGFELLPGSTTGLTGLTVQEATALLSGEVSVSLGMSPAFTSALRKVTASLPDAQRRAATDVAARVLVRPEGWLRDSTKDEHLTVVQESVFEGRRLRIEYAGRSGMTSVRTVDPLGLVYAAGRWYLLADDGGNERTFRVSRIQHAESLDEAAKRSPTIDLAAMWDSRRDKFRSTRDLLDVRLRIRSDCLEQVTATAVRVGDVTGADDGWIDVDLTLGGGGHAGSLVWMLGERCVVLAPESLRADIREHAEHIVNQYSVRED